MRQCDSCDCVYIRSSSTVRVEIVVLLNQIITAATIITVIGYMFFMSVGYILPKSIVLLNIIGFLIFFSQGAFNMTMIVMLNNTIEYDEVRFHERHDSIISAVRSFATKLASAVDQAVVALILIISNIYAISQKNIIDERKYEELVAEKKAQIKNDSIIKRSNRMKKRIIVGISIAILLCSVVFCVEVQRKSSFVEGVVIEKNEQF